VNPLSPEQAQSKKKQKKKRKRERKKFTFPKYIINKKKKITNHQKISFFLAILRGWSRNGKRTRLQSVFLGEFTLRM
jgi:hypothetical protein